MNGATLTPAQEARRQANARRELDRAAEHGRTLPTYTEAFKLARAEYGYCRSDIDGGYVLLSRAADGGMHYCGNRRTIGEARAWTEQSSEAYARRIAAGDVTGTLLFWGGSDWYLG